MMEEIIQTTIDDMIEKLQDVKKEHGNLTVTCTGSLLADGYRIGGGNIIDVFESTADNVIVDETPHKSFGEKHVRIYM